MISPEIIKIDLCICTYRRNHIIDTLRSVEALDINTLWRIRIIIADNDETPVARQSIESALKTTGLDYLYIHAPAANISIARNACLDAANNSLVAFIDDDEIVSPQWLNEMIKTLQNLNADAVMGPVNAVYSSTAPQWMKNGDFHSTLPVFSGDRVTTGGSGNVLMRTDRPAILGRRFRVDLGKSGGEDSEFFSAINRAGGHIAFAEKAIITEEVTENRATMSWLMQRRLRYGQTHGLLLLSSGTSGFTAHLKLIILASTKALFSLSMAVIMILKPDRMRFWLLRCALHTGVIVHLLGGRTLEIYGKENQA